ncbi:MAG: RNA polymerase sigma-70 factor [Macellibacteroides fermentans]|uniref:RNA polymerase sigma-70 factor n=1 Tax=Macellibacteroides fermentans TaxID=879969 RepID=UPI003AD753B0
MSRYRSIFITPVEKLFSNIYKEYYRKAFRFANLYVRNDMAAEDIAAESLVKLWETMKNECVEKPTSLLLTILKHKSLDYLRSQSRAQEVFEALENWRHRELLIRISTLDACNPEQVFSNEIRQIVGDTLSQLPSQTRKAFILSRSEHKSGKEIAQILGISVKGVDYHIAKAVSALRVSLKDYLPFIPFLFSFYN